MADVILQGVSRPDNVVFPPPDWRRSQSLRAEQDVGPELQHIYELVNNGPSDVSSSTLEVTCPLRAGDLQLLYPLEVISQGPISCSSKQTFNVLKLALLPPVARRRPAQTSPHRVQRREEHGDFLPANLSCVSVACWRLRCDVGLLQRGSSALLTVRSRIWAETFMERLYQQFVVECWVHFSVESMPYAVTPKATPPTSRQVVTAVTWNRPDSPFLVPVWVIMLAVAVGLLLLALLIYLLHKMGFFKRSDPYGTAMEKARLRPQASSEA
ncbi:hypothetical protein LDENG_00160240 [Lucifuga dentata]|nr:hypothetical protein LDENG_00160240 [Lucifuga dentata]